MVERTDLDARMSVEDATPERSAEEIRQDIADKRESLSKTVDRLGERIHQTLDWREYIGDHPYAALGIAVGVGFLIWGVFRPRPTSGERIMDALAESAEDLADRFRETVSNVSNLPLEKESGLGRAVKATAATAVTRAAIDSLLTRGVRSSSPQRAPHGAE
ncbi:MAG TPA: DUF883 C-terminal domain-containing protein [Gammaproteobacteria bacterium]|nr:DUF883 C-terminal domain-containing protein [Gammaproteobacteria bacterium]